MVFIKLLVLKSALRPEGEPTHGKGVFQTSKMAAQGNLPRICQLRLSSETTCGFNDAFRREIVAPENKCHLRNDYVCLAVSTCIIRHVCRPRVQQIIGNLHRRAVIIFFYNTFILFSWVMYFFYIKQEWRWLREKKSFHFGWVPAEDPWRICGASELTNCLILLWCTKGYKKV